VGPIFSGDYRGLPGVVAADRLLLPLPVDYLTWSHDLGEFFAQPAFDAREKSVLIGGEASALAQRKLTERGWSLALRSPFDGAPAYAQEGEFHTRRD
jgi:hypothetical protein